MIKDSQDDLGWYDYINRFNIHSYLSFIVEIAQHEERGIRAIIFMDNLSQIAIGGYRGDGTGL